MLGRIFNLNRKLKTDWTVIPVGRYSDNNKSVAQAGFWTESENLFKEKKFNESIDAFFKYLKDPETNNVSFERNENGFTFTIYQGSVVIRGEGDREHMHAKTSLAKMNQVSVPVMRRLLESNYLLFYSRFSLDGDILMMQFDSEIATANPNKLYYALKELSITADKQDDLLIQDFTSLESFDNRHVMEIPEELKKIRHDFMHQWIRETLDQVKELETEKFSGAIAFLILSLIYRIDFLVTPQGSLMNELEKIQAIYFKKDNLSAMEKNRLMLTALEKFQMHSRDEFNRNVFESLGTFSIRQPKSQQGVKDAITNANKNIAWYKDNKLPDIAAKIAEYGISFCQYSFSLPKPMIELYQLFMEVNYPDYFKAIGSDAIYFTKETSRYNREQIEARIQSIIKKWKVKYPKLNFPVNKIKYDNPVEFNQSYTNILADLDFEM